MAGYCSASGFVRGSASRLAVCMTVFGSWLLPRQSTERIMVHWSSIAAKRGRCSQMTTPGNLVLVTPNGPRFSGGRSGLGQTSGQIRREGEGPDGIPGYARVLVPFRRPQWALSNRLYHTNVAISRRVRPRRRGCLREQASEMPNVWHVPLTGS